MRRSLTSRPLLLAMLSALAGTFIGAAVAVQPTPESPASPQAASGPVTRELLAWWYLEVDKAWEEARPKADAATAKAAHETFDHATLAFFRLDMATAISELAELRRTLKGEPAVAPTAPLSLEATPRTWIKGTPAPTLTVTALRSAAATPATITLRLDAGPGRSLSHSQAWKGADPALDRRCVIDAAAWTGVDWWNSPSHPTLVTCTIEVDGRAVASDRVILASESLSAAGDRLRRAAEAIEPGDDAIRQALGMFKARVALLTDAPSRTKAGEFLAPYDTLPASLDEELASLKAGRSPYPLKGRWWTTIKTGRGSVPCWFDAPKDPIASPPLLIVFHGAGGDESMFVFGYGQGSLVRKAVDRGMVVASVATGAAMGSAGGTKSIIRQVSALYGTDPERVYVAGHSMGGFATSTTAQRAGDLVAAAVCFAGGAFDPSLPCVPTLVLAGEIDPLIPAARLKGDVDRSVKAGLPLTFRVCEGSGHTLLVGDQADEALRFLEGKRRASADAPKAEPQR